MNASDLLRNRLVNHFGIAVVSHAALTVPLSYTLGLFLNNSGLQAGAPSGEVATGSGYNRMPLTLAKGAAANELLVPNEVLFGAPTGDWGIIPYTGIFAEVTSGTYELWIWGQLTNPNTGTPESITIVNDGARARFQSNKIVITFS